MLTPAFSLEQTAEFLTIIIKAPFAKVSETDIFVEENDFKFFSKPYFLRLTLPGNIVEDGQEKADYNADKGEFRMVFAKATPGEHFEGLDMITQLLAPKGKTSASGPLIEVIDSETNVDTAIEGNEGEVKDEGVIDKDFDWCIEQTPYEEQPVSLGAPKYGFANQKSGVFERLQEDLVGIVDCPEPDKLLASDRKTQRLQAEQEKFDGDHYLGDLFEDAEIEALLKYKPPWIEEYLQVSAGKPVQSVVEITEEDEEVMRKLPRKEYLLDNQEETVVYLGLVDIIFAYIYNHRTTEGDNHCESGWTICKISSTLSWLEVFSDVKDVLVSCYRRSLCYPLYRHWKLNQRILQDLIIIFKLGRRRLLKCLLEIRAMLLDQDARYVLNDLYITDYCTWIQSANQERISSLATALSKINIEKSDVGFDLLELEKLAQSALENDDDDSDGVDNEIEHVTDQMAAITVNKYKNTGSDYVISDSDDVTTESDEVTPDSDDVTSDDLSSEEEVVNEKEGKADGNSSKRLIIPLEETYEQKLDQDSEKLSQTTTEVRNNSSEVLNNDSNQCVQKANEIEELSDKVVACNVELP